MVNLIKKIIYHFLLKNTIIIVMLVITVNTVNCLEIATNEFSLEDTNNIYFESAIRKSVKDTVSMNPYVDFNKVMINDIRFSSKTTDPLITSSDTQIIINCDEDFFTYADSGAGTQENPFIITNRIIEIESDIGITIQNTKAYFILSNNIVNNSDFYSTAFYLKNVQNAILINNTAINGYNGFSFKSISNTRISYNNAINSDSSGFYLGYSNNNTINYNNANNSRYNGFYVISSSNNKINYNNANNNGYPGFDFSYSNNNTVSYNNANNNRNAGFEFIYSNNDTISYNNANNNSFRGFNIASMTNSTLSHNNAYDSNHGFGITSGSNNNTVSYNNANNNDNYGFYFHLSTNSTISQNYAYYNRYGINLYNSKNNELNYNIVNNNKKDGFSFSNISNNILNNNIIFYNLDYGIDFGSDCKDNILKYNYFIDNNIHTTSQANDDGYNNSFKYNYWNEHIGKDSDNDGYIDTPYLIDGDANNKDQYPLVEPIEQIESIIENFDSYSSKFSSFNSLYSALGLLTFSVTIVYKKYRKN